MSKEPLLSSQVAWKIARHIRGNNSDYYSTKEGLAELESIISRHFVAIAATGTQDSMPRRYCDVHQREEFKYESWEHEIRARKARCDKCGCEYVQVGKVFTVNLGCDCDCHQRPATDFTEQARQLVEKRLGAAGSSPIYQTAGRLIEQLIDDVASFASEAATQGRSDDDYVAWCRYTHEGVDESGADTGTIVTCDSDAKGAFKVYRAPSPYLNLNRVRKEAATAALEQAAQWQPIETAPKGEEWCIVGKISGGQLLWWYRAMFWRGGWHTARSYDTRVIPSHWLPLPLVAAIGDDSERGNRD